MRPHRLRFSWLAARQHLDLRCDRGKHRPQALGPAGSRCGLGWGYLLGIEPLGDCTARILRIIIEAAVGALVLTRGITSSTSHGWLHISTPLSVVIAVSGVHRRNATCPMARLQGILSALCLGASRSLRSDVSAPSAGGATMQMFSLPTCAGGGAPAGPQTNPGQWGANISVARHLALHSASGLHWLIPTTQIWQPLALASPV